MSTPGVTTYIFLEPGAEEGQGLGMMPVEVWVNLQKVLLEVVDVPIRLSELAVPVEKYPPEPAGSRVGRLKVSQEGRLIQRCLKPLRPNQEQQQGYPDDGHEGLVVEERIDGCRRSPVPHNPAEQEGGEEEEGHQEQSDCQANPGAYDLWQL